MNTTTLRADRHNTLRMNEVLTTTSKDRLPETSGGFSIRGDRSIDGPPLHPTLRTIALDLKQRLGFGVPGVDALENDLYRLSFQQRDHPIDGLDGLRCRAAFVLYDPQNSSTANETTRN